MENERNIKRFIWTMAVVIPTAVALLFLIPPVENLSEDVKAALYVLPKLNAIFNGTAFLCLIGAFVAIKNKNIRVHRAFTTSALVLSMLFLVSYVAFHLTTESTKFGGEGWIRTVYFAVLISHILLSTGIIPLVLFTYVRGLGMQVEKHRKIAKITWPIWLYVTATGVIVYLMISPYYPH
jgi:putative membrane protein|tara:strand:- start:8227 stop:8766 length:540 start_codon:yes stop_codon:yes gene_type:complete